MRRRGILLLALAITLAVTAPAAAQVIVRVPFVRVAVDQPGGTSVRVLAPFVDVGVGSPPPVYVPAPPRPVVIVPAVPPPAPQPALLSRPLTHQEFARTFQPAPGRYEVTLIHPRTNAPVNVSFTLPPGNPRVVVERNGLEFEYGHHRHVEIRFGFAGQVRVIYRD